MCVGVREGGQGASGGAGEGRAEGTRGGLATVPLPPKGSSTTSPGRMYHAYAYAHTYAVHMPCTCHAHAQPRLASSRRATAAATPSRGGAAARTCISIAYAMWHVPCTCRAHRAKCTQQGARVQVHKCSVRDAAVQGARCRVRGGAEGCRVHGAGCAGCQGARCSSSREHHGLRECSR